MCAQLTEGWVLVGGGVWGVVMSVVVLNRWVCAEMCHGTNIELRVVGCSGAKIDCHVTRDHHVVLRSELDFDASGMISSWHFLF